MNQLTHQMSEAVVEQKHGGEMVVKAVEAIAVVSRQNLEAVEQMNSAAKSLAGESDALRQRVALLPGMSSPASPRPPAGSPSWRRRRKARTASGTSSPRWRTPRPACASGRSGSPRATSSRRCSASWWPTARTRCGGTPASRRWSGRARTRCRTWSRCCGREDRRAGAVRAPEPRAHRRHRLRPGRPSCRCSSIPTRTSPRPPSRRRASCGCARRCRRCCELLSRDLWLQLAAIAALGEIGDPDAVGPLWPSSPTRCWPSRRCRRSGASPRPESLEPLLPLLLAVRERALRDPLLLAVAVVIESASRSRAARCAGWSATSWSMAATWWPTSARSSIAPAGAGEEGEADSLLRAAATVVASAGLGRAPAGAAGPAGEGPRRPVDRGSAEPGSPTGSPRSC